MDCYQRVLRLLVGISMDASTGNNFLEKKGHLRIYNVYNPVIHNDNTNRDGSVWVQHRIALKKDGIDVKPTQHLFDTLIGMIQDDIKQERQVIVLGDFNIGVFDSKINAMFSDVGLRNVYEGYINKDAEARSWFRGRTVIDGAWCTQAVHSNIRAVGLAPFYFVHHSDHRGLYFDFDVRMVLDNHEVELLPLPYRRLRSSVPNRVKKYIEKMQDGWWLHNISEKIETIDYYFDQNGHTEDGEAMLNKIDEEIQKIFSISEKKCCNVGRHDDDDSYRK